MSKRRAVFGAARPHLSAAVLSVIWATLPVFMVGAMALQIQEELSIGLQQFSYLSAVYYTSSLILLLAGGWLTELIGSALGIRIAMAVDGFVLLAIGTLVNSYLLLALLLVLAGAINSFAQPAVNLHLVGNIPQGSMGAAFGIKQGAVPASTMIAGAAVPLLGVTLGWRSAFVLTGIVATLSIFLVRGSNIRLPRAKGRRPEVGVPLLLLLGVAAGLASGPAVAMGVYLVIAATSVGLSAATGGAVLAAASAFSIAARMVSGRLADNFPQHRLLMAGRMMFIGALGVGLLAVGNVWLFPLGAMAGFAFGWGWPAVFVLSIVTLNPSAPAFAASVTQMGAAFGSIAGPVVFGAVAGRWGFSPAWIGAAGSMTLASLILKLVRGRVEPMESACAS